jgi:hypothetical protein
VKWERPAVITYGLNNHAVQTEPLALTFRYRDGGQELYDHERDPNEWTNLASIPKYSPQKTKLAKWLPSTNADPQNLEKMHLSFLPAFAAFQKGEIKALPPEVNS